MNDEIKNSVISGRLYRIVRGEEFPFAAPSEINAEMYPTDHNELLSKAIYPLCDNLRPASALQVFESGLRAAASDALGVYCSVQCYYLQILFEKSRKSPFQIDRINLPLFLGEQFRKCKLDFLKLKLNNYDPPDGPLRLTLGANTMMAGGRGFAEYYIWLEDQEERVRRNKALDALRRKLWEIFNS